MTNPADVPIRDAATVVLLRDAPQTAGDSAGGNRVEAWLLTRVTEMVFAAGMTVFPGGRVDKADAELPFAGTSVHEIAARFECDEAAARALVGAAVRETFEETGVLLTTPAKDLSAFRAAVETGEVTFADLLREHELAIDASVLRPWARWVTPVGEARRYDTRFFIGALPDGAEAQDVTTESSAAEWIPIGAALEQAQRGERKMLPPTLVTLSSLLAFSTVAEALAAADHRVIEAVRPQIKVTEDGEVVAELPDGTSVSLGQARPR